MSQRNLRKVERAISKKSVCFAQKIFDANAVNANKLK